MKKITSRFFSLDIQTVGRFLFQNKFMEVKMAELKILKMSDIRPQPVGWLWEPYIPSGAITLIQGDGGTGKTTVSLSIAAALTRGKALPNGSTPIPSNAIIQNAEDSYTQTIRPRLEAMGADCKKIHVRNCQTIT
jgi:hypothetical protein